ncbi:aldolase [Ensifer sp. IC4062]|nr:aldolase [Ensifer sp. IC4062]
MSVNRKQTMKPLLFLPASAPLPEADILSAVQAIVFDPTGANDERDIASEITTTRCFVRIGPVENITEADLNRVLASGIDGIILTECRGPSDIQKLDVLLRVAEAIGGSAAGSVAILAEYATTPESVLSPHSLKGMSPRLKALIFSAPALAASAGCALHADQTGAASVIVAGRAAAVLRAREAGIAAFDMLPADANDEAAVRRYCAMSARNGFSAVVAQSPQQVALLDTASLSSRNSDGDGR